MINTNKVKLFEEFAAGEISNPDQNVAPAGNMDASTVTVDKTAMSGEQVRAEIIKDVDAILTNLETLSKQITESIDKDFFFEGPVNESLDSIIDFVKKEANFVKGMALLQGKYKQLLQTADSNIIAAQEYDAIKKIDAAIDKMKRARDEASGPKKDAVQQKAIQTIAKLKEKKAGIDSKFEETKEAAKEALAEVEEKMKKYEGNMPGGTQGELYDTTKRKINSETKMDGLKAKTKMLKEKGNADAAKEAADELKKIGVRSKEAEAGIKELSKDVDPKLEEQIKKIQTEIDREKDEDLAVIQSNIADLKKSLSDMDDETDPKEKKDTETKLANAKAQEDKTLEGIYYLEDYLEELKAQRAALKGEEYDKAESKVGSTEDGGSGEREENPLMKDEPKKAGRKPDSETVQKAKAAVKQAKAELKNDQEELAEIPQEIKDTEEDLEKAKDASATANPPNAEELKKMDDNIEKAEKNLKELKKNKDTDPKKVKFAEQNLLANKMKKEKALGKTKEADKLKKEIDKIGKEMAQMAADATSKSADEIISNMKKSNADNLKKQSKVIKNMFSDTKKKEKEEVEEAKSSDQEAAIQRAKDDVEELEKEIKVLKDREKELKDDEIPQDQTNLKNAEAELKAAQSKDKKDRSELGGTVDDIKKKQKDKLKSTKESKELTWDTLKEDLGLNQKAEKVHESFSIADKMRLILKR